MISAAASSEPAAASSETVTPGEQHNSSTAIYEYFRGLIAAGRLASGERLPTVRQTANDLGVAPGTAARAYKLLEQEGLVVTRTAAGTRVAPGASPLPLEITTAIRHFASAARDRVPLKDVLTAIRAEWPVSDPAA